MHSTPIVIIGAGLSGLYAACLLERQGIDYLLLEAREEVGGRILSAGDDGASRFDLGPTWFWEDTQPALARLIDKLGLQTFEQFQQGDMLMQTAAAAAPMRLPGIIEPPSMRLNGGMATLTDTLQLLIDPTRLRTGMRVQQLQLEGDSLVLTCRAAEGQFLRIQAEQVLLALPPRLALASIGFAPELPMFLQLSWQDTPTWMAGHAKYVAVYERPFWREAGLSGRAGSYCGPLAEIHDASLPDGKAALFGFIGRPAEQRRAMGEDQLRTACRTQLVQLFGKQAGEMQQEWLKDWASDPLTATAADLDDVGQHPMPPAVTASNGPWRQRLIGIGSEWSRDHAGYCAGAIQAATAGVQLLIQSRQAA